MKDFLIELLITGGVALYLTFIVLVCAIPVFMVAAAFYIGRHWH